MDSRRYVVAAAVGSAVAAGLFFVVLDRRIEAEQWGGVAAVAVLFGLFMAVWNGLLIHLDSRQRTTRNIVFEHFLGEYLALMSVAWLLVASLGHLRWQDVAWYTAAGVPVFGLVHLITRRNIKGERADGFFA